ncbi:MAG: TylF/MycF/NovP-related O-methyltransferase [Oscillospiraceae bacterium]|jgi:O-methyltransferase
MNRIVIFGAGQAGAALYRMMHHASQQVVAFGDNREDLQGTEIDGIPVLSLLQAVALRPDRVYLAIVNQEGCRAVALQLEEAGYKGEIVTVNALRQQVNLRLATARLLAEEIRGRKVPGILAELGVYQGEFAAELNRLFPSRRLYLFDTFEGFDHRDVKQEAEKQHSEAAAGDFSDTSVSAVLARLPHPEQAVVRQGYFPETAQGMPEEQYALVSLDADLYQPMYEGLRYFYPRMSPGGYLILHDYNSKQYKGAGEAVRAYCEEQGVYLFPLCDLHGTGIIVKGN